MLLRKPSINKSISASTTGRLSKDMMRIIDPYYGKKGVGWIKNPNKALYNYIYYRTTASLNDVAKKYNNNFKIETKQDIINYRKKNYSFLDQILQFLFGGF